MDAKNLKQLFAKFKNEDKCREYLVQQRWGGVPKCPHCGSNKSYVIEGGRRFKCGNQVCYKKYSVTVGTIFEASNIPLSTWFPAIYIIAAHKKGISSVQLGKDLGVTQKTAWFMLHRLRESLREKAPMLLADIVQADEVFIGGKNKNRHEEKKISLKDGPMAGKTVVMGVMHQSGYVRTEVIKTLGIESLAPMIRKNVKPGSILVTDDHHAYKHLKSEYSHVIVNHFAGEYARGVFSTNSLEGFWALFKRGYVGIYHYMSPKHLSRYFDEFSYRYNNRKLTDGEKFTLNLSNLEGRLTYKMLVHGQGSEEIGQEQETAQTAQD